MRMSAVPTTLGKIGVWGRQMPLLYPSYAGRASRAYNSRQEQIKKNYLPLNECCNIPFPFHLKQLRSKMSRCTNAQFKKLIYVTWKFKFRPFHVFASKSKTNFDYINPPNSNINFQFELNKGSIATAGTSFAKLV